MKTKLAPVSKSARRIVAKELGRKHATDRDVEKFCRGKIEYRDVPEKLATMDSIIESAWELVQRLVSYGVRFPGTPKQAAMVIAGTAYAAWRLSLDKKCQLHEHAPGVVVLRGMNLGLEFAMCYVDAIPAMYAEGFADTVAGSKDPIDRLAPLDALAMVWPDRYAGGPRLRPAKFTTERSQWGEQLLAPVPNIFTAGRKAVRQKKAK